MRVYTRLREMISNNRELLLKLDILEKKVDKHDDEIQSIFNYMKQLLIPAEQVNRKRIGFRRATESD